MEQARMIAQPTRDEVLAAEFVRDVAAAIDAVKPVTKRRTVEVDPAGNTYEERYYIDIAGQRIEFDGAAERDAALPIERAKEAIVAVAIWFSKNAPEKPADRLFRAMRDVGR